MKVSVVVAANAEYWSSGMLYAAGETVMVDTWSAVRGKYHGVFNA